MKKPFVNEISHIVYKPGDKVFCIQKMPSRTGLFLGSYSSLPCKNMVYTLKRVYEAFGQIFLQFNEIVFIPSHAENGYVSNENIAMFSENFFIPFKHLTPDEQNKYALFNCNVN